MKQVRDSINQLIREAFVYDHTTLSAMVKVDIPTPQLMMLRRVSDAVKLAVMGANRKEIVSAQDLD